MNNKQKQTNNDVQTPNFHGAALIDEDGNEIPITESMVKEACSEQRESDDESDN